MSHECGVPYANEDKYNANNLVPLFACHCQINKNDACLLLVNVVTTYQYTAAFQHSSHTVFIKAVLAASGPLSYHHTRNYSALRG
jgi:hypothetical protein